MLPSSVTRCSVSLRLALGEPRGAAGQIAEQRWGLVFDAGRGGPVVAVALAPGVGPGQLDGLRATAREMVSAQPRLDIAAFVFETGIADRVLLSSPPPAPPRWVFVSRSADGRYNCRGWGWTIDEPTRRMFDVERAEAIVAAARRSVEGHFAQTATLYLRPDDLPLAEANVDLDARERRNALTLATESDRRWRWQTVDDEEVLRRQPASRTEPAAGWWQTLTTWLRLRAAPQELDETQLQEALVQLAVRADRYERQQAERAQQEARLFDEARVATSDAARRALARKIADVRRQARRAGTFVETIRAQRSVIETHLYHQELKRAGTAVKLPAQEELMQRAAEAQQIVEELQATASVARTGEEAVIATTAASAPEAELDGILREFEQPSGTGVSPGKRMPEATEAPLSQERARPASARDINDREPPREQAPAER